MAKLVFPATKAPYRGFVGETRGWFRTIASYAQKHPRAAVALQAQVAVLSTYLAAVAATVPTEPVEGEE